MSGALVASTLFFGIHAALLAMAGPISVAGTIVAIRMKETRVQSMVVLDEGRSWTTLQRRLGSRRAPSLS